MAPAVKELVEKSTHKRVRRHHRRKHAGLVAVTVFLLIAAFALQLLVALSLPIIKGIYLLRVVATTANELVPTTIATELRFGVWGYCATSVLDIPTLFSNNGECSKPRLGYEIDSAILALTGQSELLGILLKGLTVILILHPVCAGLSLLALLPALFSFAHILAICSLVFTIASALIASLSTAVDIALVKVAMEKIGDVTSLHFAVKWGNAPWMSLAAAIVLWVVVILQSATLCGCCGVSRRLWTRPEEPNYTKGMNRNGNDL